MSSEEKSEGSVADRMSDELKLQAWLAGKEIRHPSLRQGQRRKEVSALAKARDELRVQLHLGKLEARDEWHELEGQWQRIKRLAAKAEGEVEEGLESALRTLREGYEELRGR